MPVLRLRRSLLVLVLICWAGAASAGWKAGSARVLITPQQPMWMSGYGGRDHPAEGKLTELWAKALVLDDQAGGRAVLVTLDLVGIDRLTSVAICRQLAERYGLRREQIAINCSHTHCGPVVGHNLGAMYFFGEDQWQLVDRYTMQLEAKVVELVGQALTHLAPAKVEYSEGTADFAVNRRTNKEPEVPQLRERNELRGPVDHRVPVLIVKNELGELRTVVFGYACHATVLSFYQWSGDYPAFAMQAIESTHPGVTAMFWAGCGADQNPLPRRTVELAQTYGQRLAQSVEQVLKQPLKPLEGTIVARYSEVIAPFESIPTREQLVIDSQNSNKFIAQRAKQFLARVDAGQPLSLTYPYPVQVWKLGSDLRWVILGGEVVVDYSLRLAQELGDKPVWIAGYSNDVMAYIPSVRVLREGGYEGATAMIYYGQPSPWAATIEELIVSQVRELAK